MGRRGDTGDVVVRIDPRYFRPAEVETLLGDPTNAKESWAGRQRPLKISLLKWWLSTLRKLRKKLISSVRACRGGCTEHVDHSQ